MRNPHPPDPAAARRRWQPWVLLLLWSLAQPTTALAATLQVGKPAPPFTATQLDGTRFDLAAQHGHVVLLNFWATWCQPCMAELPAMQAYASAHPDLRWLAVNLDDPEQRSKVQHVAAALNIPVAYASDAQADGYGRIWRLPMTFVVDRGGTLRVDGGAGDQKPYDAAALDAALSPLLAPPAPAQNE